MCNFKPKYYTGVGSRKTPTHILEFMQVLAKSLSRDEYMLRSGGAHGADTAFEKGAGPLSDIYLPWKRFNQHPSNLYYISDKSLELAQEFHPNWGALNQATQKLMARNGYQILGTSLDKPSEFVVCWTPDGADGVNKPTTMTTGGTGQAIRIASHYKIPVYNLGNPETLEKINDYI